MLTRYSYRVNILKFAAEVADTNIENSIVQKFCKYKSFIHTVKYAWMGTSTILKFSKNNNSESGIGQRTETRKRKAF